MKSKFLINVSFCMFSWMCVYATPDAVTLNNQGESVFQGKIPTRRNRAIPIKANQAQTVNEMRQLTALQNNQGQESAGSRQSEVFRAVNPLTQKVNVPVVAVKKNRGQLYLEQIQKDSNVNAHQSKEIGSLSKVPEKIQYFEGLKGQSAPIKPQIVQRSRLAQNTVAQKSTNQVIVNQEVPANNFNATESNYATSSDFETLYEPATIVEYTHNDLLSPVGMGDLYSSAVTESYHANNPVRSQSEAFEVAPYDLLSPVRMGDLYSSAVTESYHANNPIRSQSEAFEAAPSMADTYSTTSELGSALLKTSQRDNSYNPMPIRASKLPQQLDISRPVPLYEAPLILSVPAVESIVSKLGAVDANLLENPEQKADLEEQIVNAVAQKMSLTPQEVKVVKSTVREKVDATEKSMWFAESSNNLSQRLRDFVQYIIDQIATCVKAFRGQNVSSSTHNESKNIRKNAVTLESSKPVVVKVNEEGVIVSKSRAKEPVNLKSANSPGSIILKKGR